MLHLSWVVLCALIVSTCFFSTRSQAAEDLPAARNFTGGWHQISPCVPCPSFTYGAILQRYLQDM